MTKPKFRRSDGHKYSKLGVRRKKLQKYRKPKGGDNKIRLNRAGRLRKVKVGFRSQRNLRGLIRSRKIIMIYNVNDLKKIGKEMIGVVGKIGAKKKMEIAKLAVEKKIELLNLDAEKFLKKIEGRLKEAKEKKKKVGERKRARDKKAKEKEKEDKKKEEKKRGSDSDKKEMEDVNKNLSTDIKENMEEKK